MTTDEAARLHLFEQARNAMDEDAARTLMTALPWDVADLARKQDLALLEANLEARMDRSLAKTLFGVFAMNASLVGAVIAGLQLG